MDKKTENESFPAPHSLEIDVDTVPVDEDERESFDDLPIDDQDAFVPDADIPEFLDGEAETIVDDSHEDFEIYDDPSLVPPVSDEMSEDAPNTDDYSGDSANDLGAGKVADSSADHTATSTQKRVGRHGVPIPEHQIHSKRMRRVLIVVIILLLALIAAGGYFIYQLYENSQNVSSQQVVIESTVESDVNAAQQGEAKDTVGTTTKRTEVPALLALMGKSQNEAVAIIGHGATVSRTADVNEEGNPVKQQLTLMLTTEPADSKSGTPTVYLGLNEQGNVAMAGYSAAASSLGYGKYSFAEAVANEHIVEKTLRDTGLNVPDGTVILPEKATYSTYAGDGTTLVKESASFSGSSTVDGTAYNWSSVVTYDYTSANASGNLNDTIRQIYIYINM